MGEPPGARAGGVRPAAGIGVPLPAGQGSSTTVAA
jgi:hypothetical protein